MSELQSDTVETQQAEQPTEQQTQTHETGEDLATSNESGHEEKPEVNQDKINAAINKKHFEKMEAQRERDKALQEAEELRKQLNQQQSNEPIVPPMPDPFDDDYDERIKERESSLIERANWKAKQELLNQQQQQQAYQAQQQQAATVQKKAESYTERAKSFGIDTQELQQAGNLVAQYGISNDLTMAILDDPEGALLTKTLAANPMDLEALNSMNLYQQAMYIEQTVRPKAQQLKPRTTQAEQPPKQLNGRSADKNLGKYPHTKNAKFE